MGTGESSSLLKGGSLHGLLTHGRSPLHFGRGFRRFALGERQEMIYPWIVWACSYSPRSPTSFKDDASPWRCGGLDLPRPGQRTRRTAMREQAVEAWAQGRVPAFSRAEASTACSRMAVRRCTVAGGSEDSSLSTYVILERCCHAGGSLSGKSQHSGKKRASRVSGGRSRAGSVRVATQQGRVSAFSRAEASTACSRMAVRRCTVAGGFRRFVVKHLCHP